MPDHTAHPNKGKPRVIWKTEPDPHDYPAAANYLGLLADGKTVKDIVQRLGEAPVSTYKAKDILRSSRLRLLELENAHVASDLMKVIRGNALSPVLLVRGDVEKDVPATIADGYHRVCASYHLDENTDIPCKIVGL